MNDVRSPRLRRRAMCFGISWLMLSGFLQGGVILQDDFSTEGEENEGLEGRTPSMVDNGNVWIDSNQVSSVVAGNGTLNLLQAGTSAFVEIDALEDNTVYRVSCNLVIGNDDWVGPAFFTSTEPMNWWEGNISSFIALKASGSIELWPNGFPGSNTVFSTLEIVAGVFAIELSVDDTGAATVEYIWEGESIGSGYSLTVEEVDEINAVGFAVSGTTGAEVDDFVFESNAGAASDPVVTEVMMVETGFRIAGSGGPADGAFEILRSPDLSSPTGLWPSIGNGSFDAVGDFDFTDTAASGAENYYILRVLQGISPEGEE